jgi:hypothetical protein
MIFTLQFLKKIISNWFGTSVAMYGVKGLVMSVYLNTSYQNNIQQNQYVGAGSLDRAKMAIQKASAATGVDFSYLYNKASQESSSATGLYQFIEQTWLRTVKEFGDKHGLGDIAKKIEIGAGGLARVADQFVRKEILELRKNPEISALMAAEFTGQNKKYLENKVGGDVGSTELYMAHFLGAEGASRFLRAKQNDPSSEAAAILPEAAAANQNVFYKKSGEARSVDEIYNYFAKRMVDDKSHFIVPNTKVAVVNNIDAMPDNRPAIFSVTPQTSDNGHTFIGVNKEKRTRDTSETHFFTMMFAHASYEDMATKALSDIYRLSDQDKKETEPKTEAYSA